MNRSGGNVDGIACGDRGQNSPLHEFSGQLGHLLVDVQQLDADQKGDTFSGHDRVAVRSFFQHDFRRVKIVGCAA